MTGSSLPASPWEPIQLRLLHEGERKDKVAVILEGQRNIRAARCLEGRRLLVGGRARRGKEKERSILADQVLRLFLLLRPLMTKRHELSVAFLGHSRPISEDRPKLHNYIDDV